MTDKPRYSPASPFTVLVDGSLAGDALAWQALVRKLERVVWKAVNMMTTDDDIRKDAFAATWLRLVERLGTIREPDKLPGWLTTTATNEVRQIIRQRGRQPVSVDWSAPQDVFAGLLANAGDGDGDGEHDRELVRDEVRSTVRRAFGTLDDECRQILTVLVLADPPVPYKDASAALNRPIGSLGPSRMRCLEKLRNTPAMQSWVSGFDG
ncbi:MAG: sigma-70 family RNA polymerase sigma factor [Ilumatobacteraceae bacterium]